MQVETDQDQAFLEWLDGWYNSLEEHDLTTVAGAQPDRVAIICVDLINGFCHEGALSSKRVQAIIEPIRRLMIRAHELGVRSFILPQDSHPADSPEFSSWPAHCVTGTVEAETTAEIEELPFAELFHVIPKQTISSSIETGLEQELARLKPRTIICVGDCTDLCLYQLAMHLRLRSVARAEQVEVIVPEDCVETYDLPLDLAANIGALPHPADLLHKLFLYHLALNGVKVVGRLA